MSVERFTIEIIEEELYPMPIYYDEGKKLQYYDIMVLLNELHEENELLKTDVKYWAKTAEARLKEVEKLQQRNKRLAEKLDILQKENKRLKSDLAIVIEQAKKNDEFCRSDIKILENALWCPDCANDVKRLKELRKEFLK